MLLALARVWHRTTLPDGRGTAQHSRPRPPRAMRWGSTRPALQIPAPALCGTGWPGLREQRAAFTALTPRRDRVVNSLDAFMGCNQCTGRVGLPAISSLREHFIHTQAGWKGKKRPCMFLNAGGSYCMRGFNPSPKTSPCPAGWGQGHAAWLGSGSAAELLCNGHKSTRTCKQGREQRTWRDAMASGREGRSSSAGGWRPRKTSDQACECSWPHILQVGTKAGPALHQAEGHTGTGDVPRPQPRQRSRDTPAARCTDPPLIFPAGHSKLWCPYSEPPALGPKGTGCEAPAAACFHGQEETSNTEAG